MTRPDRELLRRVITGELDPDDERVRAAAAASPETAAALREMIDLRARLERDAGHEREALRAVAEGGDAPGQERVRETLDRLCAAGRPTSADGPGFIRSRRFLAAAALLLIGFTAGYALFFSQGEDPGPDRGVILGEALTPVSPVGPVDAFQFQWTGELARGEWFRVRVWAADAAPGAPPVLDSGRLRANEWLPAKSLPAEIRWVVALYGAGDAENALLESGPVRALRTP